MPRFVAQDSCSSLTPRALARTAYLAALIPTVDQVIDDYQRQDPTGQDYTPAVADRVREQAIALAKSAGKQPSTLKQDLGLLVPQRLVRMFGATRVFTYRNEDGSAASQRLSGWSRIADWISTYSPHRVDIAPLQRITLDTCVVRHDQLDIDQLIKLKGAHPVSLADGALLELAFWLRESKSKKNPFDRWAELAARYDRVLDPDMPIAPGGHERAAFSGLCDFEPGFYPEGFRSFSRQAWEILKALRSRSDLKGARTIEIDGTQHSISLEVTRPHLANAASKWAGMADKLGMLLRESTAKASEEELRSFFRNSVAAGTEIGNVDRLNLVVRALARRAHEAAHVGYKPDREESNDAMDFDLLFSVALPGVVCTGDAAFVRWIRSLNAPEGNLVMTPHELLVWLATDKLPSTSSTGVA